MLDVVEFGELPSVIRGGVLLEFLEGLLPQITTIHEKQHPMDFGVFDEAVYRGDRRERLPTPCRHLNECPWAVVSKRGLQILYCCTLCRPQSFALEGRKLLETTPEGGGLSRGLWFRL